MAYLPLQGAQNGKATANNVYGPKGQPAPSNSVTGLGNIPASGPEGLELVDVITDTITAQQDLAAFRVIWLADTAYADKDEITKINNPIGLTVAATLDGAPLRVVLSGLVVNPAWSWVAGLPLYLGDDGLMTQTAPATAWKIGDAISATKIYFAPTFLNADSLADGSQRIEITAAANLSGHRVVFISDSTYADILDTARAGELIGLTENGATIGQPLSILLNGFITETSWNWTVGAKLYLGANGLLTETVTATGVLWHVANAIDATTIKFNPNFWIIRA